MQVTVPPEKDEKNPVGHDVVEYAHVDAPDTENVGGVHATQELTAVPPVNVENFPGGQAVQAVTPPVAEYDPAAQAMQAAVPEA